MFCLGVNGPPAGWHDTAACLVDSSGEVIAFAEEERFNRERHSPHRSPVSAVQHCLSTGGIGIRDLDVVAVGWHTPKLYPDRFADDREFLRHVVGWPDDVPPCKVVHVPHHLAHAVSAFFASTFEDAGVVVVDGNGEREGTSIWHFRAGRPPVCLGEWSKLDSLGFAYEAASRWLGFSFLDAGKTMGLAGYGRAAGLPARSLVRMDDEGYRLAITDEALRDGWRDLDRRSQYDDILARWQAYYCQIAGADRSSKSVNDLHLDPAAVRVAHTAQVLVEDTLGWLADTIRRLTGQPALCLAGGVALNCTANGLLEPPLYVPPVPHDAGVALGAAWYVAPRVVRNEPFHPYLGAEPGAPPSDTALREAGLVSVDLDIDTVTKYLLDGQLGALVEQRSEVGPRALCHRSIIALPRPVQMRERLNQTKERERWRPFGPVARATDAALWWADQGDLSRYMIGAAAVTRDGLEVVPATSHVDGTTRPQAIGDGRTPVAAALLAALERAGAPPVLVNTSFNCRGEPIVDSATDALSAFRGLDLDFLIMGSDLIVPLHRADHGRR